ncbi:small integral membrane protein 13 [Atheta coriaria]|uniref:small integral membrane protein 13 n=1 Tax=Dalotia coriaria TaxID=877792 RepID=UPI0031F41D0D
MIEILLAVASIITSLAFVLFLILLGWYIVWKLFLSRFKFVRELLGGGSTEEQQEREKDTRSRPKRSRRD